MRLIDADELQKFPIRIDHYDTEHGDLNFVLGIETALEYADNMPTIDAEPVKHAHWIKTLSPYHFKCSLCRVIENIKYHSVEDHKFCWYCGAKMDGEIEEAEDET